MSKGERRKTTNKEEPERKKRKKVRWTGKAEGELDRMKGEKQAKTTIMNKGKRKKHGRKPTKAEGTRKGAAAGASCCCGSFSCIACF